MRFPIRPLDGKLPDRTYGPSERELQCFLPAGVEWRQLGYGQGEGQVEIAGCEWGFYFTRDGELAVVMHTGEYSAVDGMAFVLGVAEVVAKGVKYEVRFQGVDEP